MLQIILISSVANDHYISGVIDTGAELNIISSHVAENHYNNKHHPTLLLTTEGHKKTSLGETWLSLALMEIYIRKLEVRGTKLAN